MKTIKLENVTIKGTTSKRISPTTAELGELDCTGNIEIPAEELRKAMKAMHVADWNKFMYDDVDEIVKEQVAQCKEWNPETDDMWVVAGDGYVNLVAAGTYRVLRQRYISMGNAYETEEEATKARDRQKALVRLNKAIKEYNGDWEADWDSYSHKKHEIAWDFDFGRPNVGDCYCMRFNPFTEPLKDEGFPTEDHLEDIKLVFNVE